MNKELRIGHLSQIPAGEGRTFELEGLRIAVFRTRAGQVFATQAECPHRAGPLADGLIDNNVVVCPLHDRIYDLRTGAGIGTGCSIATYPARVSADGTILLAALSSAVLATASR
jgi:nitrite reductase (NADH) small subunit